MPHPRNRQNRPVLGIGALALAAAASGGGAWAWTQRMPAEYQTLEAAVQRLARSNDFGKQPISFSVTSGTYAAQLAQQRGLCKEDRCDMFAQLNPYRTYANGWDELIRQSYAVGDIEGWAASSGSIVLPRPSFRVYGPRTGWLSCTVAHEIAHVRRNHIFQQSYYNNHIVKNLKGVPEEARDLKSMAKSREQEMEADRDSADILARAGYQGRVCLDELSFLYKSSGDGRATEKDASHPGFDERYAALKDHYERREKEQAAAKAKGKTAAYLSVKPTKGSFRYNSVDNLLTFSPQ